jgi:hypothetical protein
MGTGLGLRRGALLEHQLPFVAALRAGPKMRKHMFDAIEQKATHDFWKGKVGIGVYEDLLSAVRDSGVPEAVKEFENRFIPLVKSAQTRSDADIPPGEEMTNQHGTTRMQDRRLRGWAGIYALCLAAFVAAAVFGFKVVRKTAAEPPVFEATITAVHSTEPASETMNEPAQAVAVEATISDTNVTEPVSETTTDPIPEISLEQKLSNED